jgi:transcriptional regulator of arginine metabolism
MSIKARRQAKLMELIQDGEIETQLELTRLLNAAGFEVTQATVSRDIHEMKLTKRPAAGGGGQYTLPTQLDDLGLDRMYRVFKDGMVSMDYAGNLLVVRTFNGMAMAVGAAIDAMRFPEMLGCIAGDDVVMCVAKTEADAAHLMNQMKK